MKFFCLTPEIPFLYKFGKQNSKLFLGAEVWYLELLKHADFIKDVQFSNLVRQFHWKNWSQIIKFVKLLVSYEQWTMKYEQCTNLS